MNGEPDYGGDGKWRSFNPRGTTGGNNTTGVSVDSGVLNPELLKGKKGSRIWPKMRLKDRVTRITHEYEELRAGGKHVRGHEGVGEDRTPDQPAIKGAAIKQGEGEVGRCRALRLPASFPLPSWRPTIAESRDLYQLLDPGDKSTVCPSTPPRPLPILSSRLLREASNSAFRSNPSLLTR